MVDASLLSEGEIKNNLDNVFVRKNHQPIHKEMKILYELILKMQKRLDTLTAEVELLRTEVLLK